MALFIKSKIQFFESKSQHTVIWLVSRCGCLSSQRYNFLKANHNVQHTLSVTFLVVYQVKDTIFWKQITTNRIQFLCLHKLFIKSKIQFFESKSQHSTASNYRVIGCLSSQRYNFLKANHNSSARACDNDFVVYQVKDTIFWKQITTSLFVWPSSLCCLSSQRYNFLKANHNSKIFFITLAQVVYQVKDTIFWKQITTPIAMFAFTVCCLSSQRYNFLKANHNALHPQSFHPLVVYQVKDTIFWKQITTETLIQKWAKKLFIKSKIQFFESKSQHIVILLYLCRCCLSSQRYNFLKANHNKPDCVS